MEFVVLDDEVVFRKKVKKIIDKLFIKNDEYYHISEFEKFDNKFKKLIKNGSTKIYILDIELKDSMSGIDIAREIRKVDWESIIIFVTSHNELGYQALKAKIMLLDFISKYDDCDNSLEHVVSLAISKVKEHKTVTFNSDGVSYIIHLNDILYIEKDTVDRKCIVKTVYNNIVVNKTLNYMKDVLGGDFYMSHRSCLVNTKRITKIDWVSGIIYFDNGETTDLLSRDKRKDFKKYVGV